MFTSVSQSLMVRGLLAIAIGAVAIAWPGITVLTLAVLFAVSAFFAATTQFAVAFSSDKAKPVIAHLLLGFVDVAAGVVALAWPSATALVLVILLASWAVLAGGMEIYAAFRSGEPAGTRAVLILLGVVSAAFGVVLFAHPGMGVLSLALLFGLFSVVSGTAMVIQSLEIRSFNKSLRSLAGPAKQHATA